MTMIVLAQSSAHDLGHFLYIVAPSFQHSDLSAHPGQFASVSTPHAAAAGGGGGRVQGAARAAPGHTAVGPEAAAAAAPAVPTQRAPVSLAQAVEQDAQHCAHVVPLEHSPFAARSMQI